MIKSIQQFYNDGVKNLENIFVEYSTDFTKVAEMVEGVTKSMIKLGTSMIAEEWEFYDELLRQRKALRTDWEIIRRDEVTKLTSLGEVTYHKTYFKNKKTGERSYLLDRLMGFEKGERLTEDAIVKILDEATDSSYRKGGIHASISDIAVSKETVMDKIHSLEFPKVRPLEEKKQVKVLYIDADEDHVSLQYTDSIGEEKEGGKGHTYMPKLAYVYEGINTEMNRHELIHVKYFGGGYEGTEGTEQLWKEIYEYIEESYDEEVLEKIYVNGDGAEWIKAGAKVHEKAKFVLDKYHLHKYIVAATSHLLDSQSDARSEIWEAINGKRKWAAEKAFNRILEVTESETKKKAVEASKKYVLGHWGAIMNKVRNKEDDIHCSAEGHISHIFSERLSSRPLGWSKKGADNVARLRVYKKNQGNLLELVRYQKQEKAVGAEEVVYSANQMLAAERFARNREVSPECRVTVSHIHRLKRLRTSKIIYMDCRK